jgi:hypothetical protein
LYESDNANLGTITIVVSWRLKNGNYFNF